MMLWTWQSPNFDPFVDRVDRLKSEWMVTPPHPDLLLAYGELDTLLALPKKQEHQFIWCFTANCSEGALSSQLQFEIADFSRKTSAGVR